MNDIALLALREMLERLLETTTFYSPPNNLLPDKWIAASSLQKGVRRGNLNLVLRAFETLWNIDPRYARRRVATIAFEDVGLGNPELVAVTAMACSGTKYLPTEKIYPAVYACAVGLASSPKCRSAEHIYTALSFHEDFDLLRDRYAHKSEQQLIDIMLDTDRYLLERSVAAWYLAGTKRFIGGMMYTLKGNFSLFEWATEQLHIDPWQAVMTLTGIRVTQCALPIYWPLKLSQKECGVSSIRQIKLNHEEYENKIPPYVLDQFTRGGKAVIRSYLSENNSLTRWLDKKLPRRCWQMTVDMGLFYLTSDVLDQEYVFAGSDKLKRLSVEADCCRWELKIEDVDQLLKLLSDNLDEIQRRRTRFITEAGW